MGIASEFFRDSTLVKETSVLIWTQEGVGLIEGPWQEKEGEGRVPS